MANVLQFALGLSAGNFIGVAGAAKLALGGLLAVGTGVGMVIGGVAVQMRRGAGLNDLANRTGESVGNLVKLQRGFEITGVAAESVTGIIGALQRSLGGMNEQGEPTKKIFAGIGLSIEELKKLDAPGQIENIFKALRSMDRSSGAFAAGQIFGRGQGGAVMQAARDSTAFGEAMKRAGNEAAIFQRAAAVFDRLDDQLVVLKARLAEVFAGLAEKFANVALVAQQAFADGKLTELIFLGISAGFEKAWKFGASLFGDLGFWAGFTATAEAAFDLVAGLFAQKLVTPFAYVSALLDKGARVYGSMTIPMTPFAYSFALLEKGGQALLEKGGQASTGGTKTFSELLATQKALWGAAAVAAGNPGKNAAALDVGVKAMADAAARAAKNSGGPMQEAFNKVFDEIAGRVPKDAPVEPGTNSITGEGAGGKGGKGGKSDAADALTRIGGFSSFGAGGDPADRTARNTADALAQLKQMNALMRRRWLQPGIAEFVNA